MMTNCPAAPPGDGAVLPAEGRELLPGEIAPPGQSTPVVGYLQLLPAPWSHRTVLVIVSAYEAAGLLRVIRCHAQYD